MFKPKQPETINLNNLKAVEVLDVLMGSGKTYASLRHIESLALANKQVRWVFCTEFISEIESRTKENSEAKHLWRTPSNDDGTKLRDFIGLLNEPDVQLIAITHALFKDAAGSYEVQNLIAKNGWCLFLDETFDCINPYGGIAAPEFMWHKDQGRLTVDDDAYGRVKWVDDSVLDYAKSKELAVCRLLKEQQNVYAAVNGKQVSLVTIEPKVMFTMWHRVILSTYQFEGTLMCAYFNMKGIKWVPCVDIVCYRLATKEQIKANITMITKYDRAFSKLSLSAGWYEGKATAEDFALINKTIRNIGDAYGCKGEAYKLGYTLPKSVLGKQTDKKKVQPKGYKHTDCLIDSDGVEIENTVCKRRSGHIPCNARASNEYAAKVVMVHVFDRYPNVSVTNYLRVHGVEFSKERFAINELVQWLWRSAIRNGSPIHVAILSKRMRELFLTWLDA